MKKLIFIVSLFFCANAFAQGFGTLYPTVKIEETDGTPAGNLKKLKVSSDSLTNDGNGTFTLLTGSGGGGGGGTATIVQNNDVTTVTSASTIDFSSRFLITANPSTEANVELANSGVTVGSYKAPALTVDQYGRITAAASSSLTGLTDVNSATQGAGRLLVSDGNQFNSSNLLLVDYTKNVTSTAGNIGIANTTPLTKLVINSTQNTFYPVPAALLKNSTASTNISSVLPSLGLGTPPTTTSAGNIVRLGFYHPQNLANVAEILSAGIDFVANAAAGNFAETGDLTFNFNTGNTGGIIMAEKMRIKDSGNVGINDSTPSQKLEVDGNVNLSVGTERYMIAGAVLSLTGLSDVNSNTQGAGRILISDGSKFNSTSVSGCTVTAGGLFTCTGASGLSDLSDVNSSTQGAGRILISDGSQFNSSALSGDVTVTSGGVATVPYSDTINVKAYGAVGNGSTDDYAAINLAIAAAASKPLFFPSGTYQTSAQLVFTGPVFGNGMEGTNVSTIRASGAMTSVVELSNTVASLTDIEIAANDQATYGISTLNANYGLIERVKITNALKDGIYVDPTGNNNGLIIRNCIIGANGTTYTTGDVTTVASNTTITFVGAPDLTTLGLRPDIDFIKINGETIPNQIDSVTNATQLVVYPAPVASLNNVTFSLKSGNGILVAKGVDNNQLVIEGNSFSNSSAAGLMEIEAGYGAIATGNEYEGDYFGRVIGSTSGSSLVYSATDIGNYYELGTYADIYLDYAIDPVIISPIYGTIIKQLTTSFEYTSILGGKILTSNVGIGTTSPARSLQVGANDGQAISIEKSGGQSFAGRVSAGVIRFGQGTGNDMLIGRSRESGVGALNTGYQGAIMMLQDNGNVGIGDITPVQKLEVGGDINLSTGGNYRRGGAVLTLTGLSDVNSNTQGVGRILISDGSKFNSALVGGECVVTASGSFDCANGSGATQLTGLSDVNSATQGRGRLLVSDGNKFGSLNIGTDTQVLTADSAVQFGVKWAAAGAGVTALVDLTDVNSSTQGEGRILISDGNQFNSTGISGDVTMNQAGNVQLGAGVVGPTEIATDGVSADELNATGVEAELEAVLDLNELQGQITDTQIADGAVDGGTGGEIADDSITAADIAGINSLTATSGRILIADGNGFTSMGVTGCTLLSSGALSCPGSITDLNGLSDVNSSTQGFGRILISDTNQFNSAAMSGDVTLDAGGVAAIQANSVVLGADTTGGYAGSATEAGAATSLLGINSITQGIGRILVSDGGNFNSTTMSGDITIIGNGTTAIGSSKVTSAMIVDDTITAADIAGINSLTATSGRILIADGNSFNSANYSRTIGQSIKSPVTATTYVGPKFANTSTVSSCECLNVAGTSVVVTLNQCNGSQASCGRITNPATCTTTSTSMPLSGVGTLTGGNDMNVTLGTFVGSPTDVRWSCKNTE